MYESELHVTAPESVAGTVTVRIRNIRPHDVAVTGGSEEVCDLRLTERGEGPQARRTAHGGIHVTGRIRAVMSDVVGGDAADADVHIGIRRILAAAYAALVPHVEAEEYRVGIRSLGQGAVTHGIDDVGRAGSGLHGRGRPVHHYYQQAVGGIAGIVVVDHHGDDLAGRQRVARAVIVIVHYGNHRRPGFIDGGRERNVRGGQTFRRVLGITVTARSGLEEATGNHTAGCVVNRQRRGIVAAADGIDATVGILHQTSNRDAAGQVAVAQLHLAAHGHAEFPIHERQRIVGDGPVGVGADTGRKVALRAPQAVGIIPVVSFGSADIYGVYAVGEARRQGRLIAVGPGILPAAGIGVYRKEKLRAGFIALIGEDLVAGSRQQEPRIEFLNSSDTDLIIVGDADYSSGGHGSVGR